MPPPVFVDGDGRLYATPLTARCRTQLAASTTAPAAFTARALRVTSPPGVTPPTPALTVSARPLELMHIVSQHLYRLEVAYTTRPFAAAADAAAANSSSSSSSGGGGGTSLVSFVEARTLLCVGELVDPRPFLRHIVSPTTAAALGLAAVASTGGDGSDDSGGE